MDKDIFEDLLELELFKLETKIDFIKGFIHKYATNYNEDTCPMRDNHSILQALYWGDWITFCPLCQKQISFE